MGFNLTGTEIRNTYPRLVTISGSVISNGTGSDISNLTVTSSFALTASVALNVPATASFAISASRAISASHAGQSETVFTQQTNANQNHFVAFVATTDDYEVLETDNQLVYNPNNNLLTVTASFANNAASASFVTSASFAQTASFLLGTIATASYALNAADAELLDGNDGTYYRDASNINAGTLSATRLSGGYTINVTGSLLGTASFATNAGSAGSSTSASYAANADLLDSQDGTFYRNANNINAGTLGSGRLSGTYTIDIAGNAATATSASFASTVASGININANNITSSNALITNLVATSASIGYLKATTGSVVTIGSQFIILNSDSPAARYAGIQVYDSGSGLTGSFEWDSVDDNWIQVATNGTTAGFLTGLSGSKGNEAYPANNTILKGTGNHTLQNSIITDDGSTVNVAGTVSASVFVGPLNGNASTATTASFALSASSAPSPFPFQGDAQFSGSIRLTGSNSTSGNTIMEWGRADLFERGLLTTFTNGAAVYSNRGNSILYLGVNQSGQQELITLGASAGVGFFGLAGGGNPYSFFNTAAGAIFNRPLTVSSSITLTGSLSISGSVTSNFTATGSSNIIAERSTITGGSGNRAILGGDSNTITNGTNPSIVSSINSTINNGGSFVTILGNRSSTVNGGDTIWLIGGQGNTITNGYNGGIFSGRDNILNTGTANGFGGGNLWGGYQNQMLGNGLGFSEILGGRENIISGSSMSGSVIIGGFNNRINNLTGAIVIGSNVTASAENTVHLGNTIVSGSVRGEVDVLTIASNTASLDCSLSSFFTLTLVSGSTTHVNPTNILPGQTINLLVNTTGSGLISFPSSVKQSTVYTPTTGSGTLGKDILTFISFDNTTLYMNNVKNLV